VRQPELSSIFGKEVSRDLIGHLRGAKLIGSGPRSPTPGAPYTYVTTKGFLLEFGLDTLRDLPDFEALEDATFATCRASLFAPTSRRTCRGPAVRSEAQ
jgi:chromosome segregation and condensation protein ScpB